MKKFKVSYKGNSTRFKGFSIEVSSNTAREAVEDVYGEVLDSNYFPQDDGRILDCSGEEVALADDTQIEYDGGSFSAKEVEV